MTEIWMRGWHFNSSFKFKLERTVKTEGGRITIKHLWFACIISGSLPDPSLQFEHHAKLITRLCVTETLTCLAFSQTPADTHPSGCQLGCQFAGRSTPTNKLVPQWQQHCSWPGSSAHYVKTHVCKTEIMAITHSSRKITVSVNSCQWQYLQSHLSPWVNSAGVLRQRPLTLDICDKHWCLHG